jgi:hypothetical protein
MYLIGLTVNGTCVEDGVVTFNVAVENENNVFSYDELRYDAVFNVSKYDRVVVGLRYENEKLFACGCDLNDYTLIDVDGNLLTEPRDVVLKSIWNGKKFDKCLVSDYKCNIIELSESDLNNNTNRKFVNGVIRGNINCFYVDVYDGSCVCVKDLASKSVFEKVEVFLDTVVKGL